MGDDYKRLLHLHPRIAACPFQFGDLVQIFADPCVVALGLEGKSGNVYGHTIPSSSGVVMSVPCDDDFAVNVYFEDLKAGFWLPEHLVHFIDGGAGATVTVENKTFIRQIDGRLRENVDP